jgi:hypothetical protein
VALASPLPAGASASSSSRPASPQPPSPAIGRCGPGLPRLPASRRRRDRSPRPQPTAPSLPDAGAGKTQHPLHRADCFQFAGATPCVPAVGRCPWPPTATRTQVQQSTQFRRRQPSWRPMPPLPFSGRHRRRLPGRGRGLPPPSRRGSPPRCPARHGLPPPLCWSRSATPSLPAQVWTPCLAPPPSLPRARSPFSDPPTAVFFHS